MASPADVLGVDRDAAPAAIERAYRERVMEVHPDRGGSTEEFKAVRDAYEALLASEIAGIEDGPFRPGAVAEDDVAEVTTQVEYLDYAVLDDHDWSLTDEDLFERAGKADIGDVGFGNFEVHPGESLLQAAERQGFTWPYACRGGACANCAVAVVEGALDMPLNHVLPPELTEKGIQLSCVGTPITDELKVVFNVKAMPSLEELRLPPGPFKRANGHD